MATPSLLACQVLMCCILFVAGSFCVLRTSNIARDPNMSKSMKAVHIGYIVFYAIFDLIQVLNYFTIFNQSCVLWYICSMLSLLAARFVLTAEMLTRANVFIYATQLRGHGRFSTIMFSSFGILSVIFLALTLSLNVTYAQLLDDSICILPYNYSSMDNIAGFVLTLLTHIFVAVIGIVCVVYCIRSLRYMSIERFGVTDPRRHPLDRLARKFALLLGGLICSYTFVLFSSVYLTNFALFGLVIGFDGLVITCVDMLMYRKYDRVFDVCCKCLLPPPPPDKLKNLQQITDLFAKKYESQYEPLILEALNQPTTHLSQDVIRVIVEYLKPITDLEQHRVYKPFWVPWFIDNTNHEYTIKTWTSSKYGGVPYLKPHENWPTCNQCSSRYVLFLQLNMDDLPDEFLQMWLPSKFRDLYQNMMLQYFQCIKPTCFHETPAANALLRFVRVAGNGGTKTTHEFEQTDAYGGSSDEVQEHWKHCRREFDDVTMQQRSRANARGLMTLKPQIVESWIKKPAVDNERSQAPDSGDGDEKKDDVYDFTKYEYESPSLKEYQIFHQGVFNGMNVISRELEENKWNQEVLHDLLKVPSDRDKLSGYFCSLAEPSLKNEYLCCDVCGNYMPTMLYQLSGYQAGHQYDNEQLAGIFICDNHPLQPQLVLLNKVEQDFRFNL